MTTNTRNTKYINQHGYSVAEEFHQFMTQSVLPATGLTANEFWSIFSSTLDVATQGANTPATSTCGNNDIKRTELEVPLLDASFNLNAINSRWGSLYQALYNDQIIPHCAGLKPGNEPGKKINPARRERVVKCAKDFLDSAFPLSEGSHRDAVSYMVYFQNLLVILADGSTTGLQTPKQFVGKNGPTNEPESILLKHEGMHTEILFDRNGVNGQADFAGIDDIQLEASCNTVLNFTANSDAEKCRAYQNWFDLVNSNSTDNPDAPVRQSNKCFSKTCGEVFFLHQSEWAIKLADNAHNSALVLNKDGQPISESILDALTAALIYSGAKTQTAQLNMYIPSGDTSVSDTLFNELGQLIGLVRNSVCPLPAAQRPDTQVKVLAQSADILPLPENRSETDDTPAMDLAVIGALASHGYDVAASQ